ncbi:MAG: protein kinase [Polyangiales bacterium]
MRKLCLRCGSKFVSQAEYCPHDGTLLVTDHEIPDPLLGTVLLEQFRIEEQIGTGGMGTVYRAHQTTVGRDVAIKVLRQELARDEHAVCRFEREGRLAIALDHPNLVRVFLTGRLGDGRLYIVMELLEGRTLAEELEQLGPPSLERAVILLMKLCAALGAVHSAGVVHRDIKPQNVYLVRRGKDEDFVKLVDFGIARVLHAENVASTTTQSGRVFGTAAYISPEAATGDDTDHRSDIYSLGVLAYQLFTGELPFEGSTAGAILMQHVHREPPPIRSKGRGAEVPDDLAMVVMRALRKDRDARQQTLAELLDSLAEAAGRAGLLNDARALLLGTVWGDELATRGSYLGDLLESSTPPTAPAALADTRPAAFMRNPAEEALLSSAPKPFGTTGHDLVAVPGLDRPTPPWRWTLLGVLALAMVGVAAGTWWRQRASQSLQNTVTTETTLTVHGEPAVAEAAVDEPLVDVATDDPLTKPDAQPVGEELPKQEIRKTDPVPQKQTKPKKTSAPTRSKASKRPARRPAAAKAPVTAKASATEPAQPELEPDEGIDWTVPGFPEEAPTGTPDAPPKNPIVIDEPPAP